MSSITKQRIGKYIYLYESTSYWDKEKGPRNKKVSIGRIDPKSGEPVYKPEYLTRVAPQSSPKLEDNLTTGSSHKPWTLQCSEKLYAPMLEENSCISLLLSCI